jgi:hypothetical protein
MTWLRSPGERQRAGSIRSARVLTVPTIRTAWGIPAGVQTARSGGAIQAP